jgi:hypothetical protein
MVGIENHPLPVGSNPKRQRAGRVVARVRVSPAAPRAARQIAHAKPASLIRPSPKE